MNRDARARAREKEGERGTDTYSRKTHYYYTYVASLDAACALSAVPANLPEANRSTLFFNIVRCTGETLAADTTEKIEFKQADV